MEGGGGGVFSVEKAICPSVSSERLVPTGRERDGYLKMRRMEDKMKRGEEGACRRRGGDLMNKEGNSGRGNGECGMSDTCRG